MKDKFQDIVWVATDGEGLYMLYNDTFTMTNTLLNTPAYQVNNPVRSLYLDPQQTLWIGTKGSGILRIPNYLVNNTPEKHDRLITGNSTLTDNSVYCFAPGGKDRLWIGTENGINYYSYSTHQLKELAVQANGTKVKYVHSIDQTNDSTLWISTVGEGIVKVTLENQRKDPIVKHATRTLVSNGHMASNYFFTSYRESSSTLWFGNRGLGAYRIDVRTGEMAQFRFNNLVNSQTANDVFAIHKNEQGYWLGTGSGLLRFYSNEDGNPDSISAKLYTNSTVHGILEDNRGNLWVSTNQGLMRLNPQEQTKQTYNNGNGLAVTEFSDGAFYKDNATGILFFGGVNGFVTVKPDSYITTDYMPEISLKGLSIFGKEYNLHDFLHYKDGKPVLQLDYKHNFFQLNFRITDYINGNDYFYSYKLKEASDQWIENGVSPNAIFSNLSPGEYTLFVKYRNNINGKESHPQAFTIYIAPPWYLSTWAYVGYFLLLMLVVTSCSEKQIDGNVINVAEAMSRLSEGQSVQNLFSSISYIPLETNEQAIIGKYPECIIMDSAILVSSVHQNLKLFDRTNGKYIRDIGHVGTDPEGYAKDSWGKVSFWADAVRRTVYLLGWNNDFLLYGFDGKYKDRIRLQDTVNCILSQNYYLMDADRIWGHNKMKLSPETPSVFYMDRNTMSLTGIATWNSALLPMDEVLSVSNLLGGNVAYGGDLAMAEFVGDRKYYTAINSPSLWKSKDAIRVKQAFNDTIYTISEQGLTPYLVFELGEWHWSEQQQLDVEGCDKKIAIDYILENAEYIYFHFHTSLYLEESQSYCGFYHKEKKTVVCQKGDSLFDKMNNQHIQIRGVTSDGHFFALLQPDELSDDNQRRMGVEEEGNPIMVMLY